MKTNILLQLIIIIGLFFLASIKGNYIHYSPDSVFTYFEDHRISFNNLVFFSSCILPFLTTHLITSNNFNAYLAVISLLIFLQIISHQFLHKSFNFYNETIVIHAVVIISLFFIRVIKRPKENFLFIMLFSLFLVVKIYYSFDKFIIDTIYRDNVGFDIKFKKLNPSNKYNSDHNPGHYRRPIMGKTNVPSGHFVIKLDAKKTDLFYTNLTSKEESLINYIKTRAIGMSIKTEDNYFSYPCSSDESCISVNKLNKRLQDYNKETRAIVKELNKEKTDPNKNLSKFLMEINKNIVFFKDKKVNNINNIKFNKRSSKIIKTKSEILDVNNIENLISKMNDASILLKSQSDKVNKILTINFKNFNDISNKNVETYKIITDYLIDEYNPNSNRGDFKLPERRVYIENNKPNRSYDEYQYHGIFNSFNELYDSKKIKIKIGQEEYYKIDDKYYISNNKRKLVNLKKSNIVVGNINFTLYKFDNFVFFNIDDITFVLKKYKFMPD